MPNTNPVPLPNGIKIPSVDYLLDSDGSPLGILKVADLLSALEEVASDLPETDPQLPDRIWLNAGVFTFTGSTGLVGDLLVGTAWVA